MSSKRKINTRPDITITTHNAFITAYGLEKLNINEKRLLYLALSQVGMHDSGFLEYELTVPEFCKICGVDKANLYRKTNGICEIERIARRLMGTIISIKQPEYCDKKNDMFTVFSRCCYDESKIMFRLNPDMTQFLLDLGVARHFTSVRLNQMLQLSSSKSMAIWHLMCREMKPGKVMNEFDLGLDELLRVTDTKGTMQKLSTFKAYVMDVALKEFEEKFGLVTKYINIKQGNTVTGFHFKVITKNAKQPKIAENRSDKIRRIALANHHIELTDNEVSTIIADIEKYGQKPKNEDAYISKCILNYVESKKSEKSTESAMQSKSKNYSWNNYPQREYDFEAFEKEILNE